MRKARLFKLFTTFIIVLMLGTLLCACEMFGGGSTANNNGTGNENKSEAKPALNTVFASYDKVEEKGSVATMELTFTLYVPLNGEINEYTFGVKNKLERKDDDEEVYVRTDIEPFRVDDRATGLISGIKTAIGLMFDTGIGLPESKSVQAKLKEATEYLDYVKAFLLNKIDLGVEIGKKNKDYNVIAKYINSSSSGNISEEVYMGASEEGIQEMLSLSPGAKIFYDTFITSALFENLAKDTTVHKEDGAKKVFNSDGKAAYDITLKENKVFDALKNFVLDVMGLEDIDLGEDFNKYVAVNKADMEVQVNKEKLPDYMNTATRLDVNVPVDDITDMISNAHSDGKIDEETTEFVNFLFNLLGKSVCGVNGEKETIGLTVELNTQEVFGYKVSNYDTDDEDDRLFEEMDENVDGRLDIKNILDNAVELPVEYLGEFLTLVTDQKVKETLVLNALDLLEGGFFGIYTQQELKTALFNALNNYQTEDETLKAILEEIKLGLN